VLLNDLLTVRLTGRTSRFESKHTIADLNNVIAELRKSVMGNAIISADIDYLIDVRTRIDQLTNLQEAWKKAPSWLSASVYRENTIWGMLLSFGVPRRKRSTMTRLRNLLNSCRREGKILMATMSGWNALAI
jgi:hypothetical protein